MLISKSNRCALLQASPLEAIAIELTTRCNLTCKMCGLWKRHVQDFSHEKVLSCLNEARDFGALRFDPWGTEVFMREDMPEILSHADRIGFREIYVVTNGVLLNRTNLVDKLAALKSLVIVISIDGPKEVHDGIRGNGVYDQAVSTLRELSQRGIKTSISSIIMRPTLDHLRHIVDLAVDLKIPVISMQPYCRSLADPSCDHEMFEFSSDDKRMIGGKIKELLRYAKQKKIVLYTGNMLKQVAPYLAEGVKPVPSKGCRVPSKTLVVDIEGNTHPCFEIMNNMGNVNNGSLSSIWHSDIHKKFFISALERKCPGCLRACSDVEGYDNEIRHLFRQWADFPARRLIRKIIKAAGLHSG